jgi:ribonucleotide monophosphatase NagD (HAD superfamily)
MPIDVPEYVSKAAERGLEWHRQGKSGDGVTDQTLREARDMVKGFVSEDKVRRMGPWFRRHRADMSAPKNDPDNKAFPGAGAVAWALWGGPTSGDIMRTAEWAEAKVAQLDRKANARAGKPKAQEPSMPQIIITDIDGTILENGQPVQRVIDYIKAEGYPVALLTNRPESDREKTVEDLKATGLDYFRLIMNAGSAPAPEYKAKEVQGLLDEGFDPDVFIDNDPANREAVAALGVVVADPADLNAESENAENEDESVDMSSKALAVDRFSKIKMTIEDKLSTAELLAQALTSERDDLRATVEKLTVGAADELTAIKADLVTKEAALADLGVSLEKANAERDAFAAKIAELEATKVSASKEAAKIAASVGVEPTAIIPGSDNAAAKVDVLATYNSLTDPKAKADFFAKNAQAIYASIKV